MRKVSVMVLMMLLTCSGCQSLQAGRAKTVTASVAQALVVSNETNIHYTGRFCGQCHESAPVEGGDTHLKFNGDYQQLCGPCHQGMSPGYCHPLSMDSKQNEDLNLPDDFPLVDGKLTCNSCHNVYRQCRKRLFDRQSLRGAPYPRKTDFCYRCHDDSSYAALNAHRQRQADGGLDTKMCLYCHDGKPDEGSAIYEDVTFVGDIKALCRRCHQVEGNHAGNFDHMANKPSSEGLRRMEAMRVTYNIILPLTRDGKMTCITCHNPHEEGVIPVDRASARGADSRYRHRLPGKMCEGCHQM